MKKTLLLLGLLLVGVSMMAQTHSYYFNNNFNEASGGPAVTESIICGGSNGSFSSQTITTGTGNCGTRTAFDFNPGDGLTYNNSNFINGVYTIHVFFKFNTLSNYQRIIDFLNGTNDEGIYTNNNSLYVSDGTTGPGLTTTCSFTANTFYLITLVRDASKNFMVYVDGSPCLAAPFNDAADFYVPTTTTTPITFFNDNPTGINTCEHVNGSIKFLSLSNSASTAPDIATTYATLCSMIALPVSLTGFSIKKQNANAVLNWQTETEINASHFEIERSSDGKNFVSVGRVTAINQAGKQNYSFTDVAPIKGINFYRLKTVDRDGAFKYSSINKLSFGGQLVFSIFPNPAQDMVTISGITDDRIIKLLSSDGKELIKRRATGQSMTLNLSGYAPGFYIIQYDNGKTIYREKFIKQ